MDEKIRSRRKFCREITSLSLVGILPVPVLHACFSGESENPGNQLMTDMSKADQKKNNFFEPGYLRLHRTGELRARADVLWEMMNVCRLCPRKCGSDRISGQKGAYCKATSQLRVSSYNPHFGEEKPLVGTNGSGTVFFTHCGLLCVFCINWEVSQGGMGKDTGIKQLSDMMLRLQKMGCHNINVVSPSHYSPHILLALDRAASEGLRLPLVYNTSGFERLEILKILDGIVDIYLSDFKYFDSEMSAKYSPGAETYPEVTKKALIEMNRQVGIADPKANSGILQRGLIIRHLVMPNNVGNTDQLLEWIAGNLPRNTYVNLMSQYTPVFRADEYPEINRRITVKEYRNAIKSAIGAGLTNLDIQG